MELGRILPRLSYWDASGVQLADAGGALPLAGFYLLLTLRFARAIRNRFSADETAAAALATLFVSVVLGGLVLALGQLWDGFAEMARVGNQHLTYRALRLGWRQHTALVFVIAVVFFWVAVLLSYRARSPRATRAAQPVRMK
jgi:hypothetical protein